MQRRIALSLMLLMVFLGTTAVSTSATTLTYANFPPAPTFPCVQMERWADEVEKRTDGALTIETFPGGTLLGAKQIWRGVQYGQADIGCISLAYQPGLFPLMSVMELPLGLPSAETASTLMWDLFTSYSPEEFDKVKVLTMFTSAPSNIMSKKPLPDLASLQGVELRGSGTASRILEALGATPVSMPMPDTPQALQKGVVQGLFSSLEVLKDLNFAAYCQHVTRTDLQVYPFAVIMNKRVWEDLPESTKKILNELGPEQAAWTGRYMDNHVQKALAWAQKEHGLTTHALSATALEAVQPKLDKLIEEWVQDASAKGLPAKAVLRDISARLDKAEAKGE
ncbi:TRAP transporter substrate-binding protein [Desulfohalobium retbaense]|uniref:Extracellular solute-binding protein n=1 Tax=Desulfohalobium retbaense (strain ATCC 49708 / DSM 5692 / JCM 16813 / HR100) TaxID=485915 RepID=C8X5P1_DESRD|nr:TRAP transporter substrate-binding protein [Desulfohalobium retbaense]ACV69738.1 Extracellular solute-binding protein [Desulfohalobium retbaense DSM 5692]